jgi:hypothetical protein
VTVSSSMSMAVGDDGDHEGISDDLSCVGECSNSDEDQDSEEFRDCIEGRYTDEDNLMRRVGAWKYDRNTDSHANDYIYYYRRSGSRANDDGPPSDFRAHDDGPPSDFRARNDVPPNNNRLDHESGNDWRTYIEILSPSNTPSTHTGSMLGPGYIAVTLLSIRKPRRALSTARVVLGAA